MHVLKNNLCLWDIQPSNIFRKNKVDNKTTGAGCIKKWLKLTMIKCKRHPIRSAYLRVNHYFNYKIVIKKVIKSFIQPAPDILMKNLVIFSSDARNYVRNIFTPWNQAGYRKIPIMHLEITRINI
jgi:hypothetical protein